MRNGSRFMWLCVLVAALPATVMAAPNQDHGDDAAEVGHVEDPHATAPVDAHGAAQDAAHGESHERSPLLSFDPGMALWTIIVFVLLMLLLRAVAWKPILQGLQQREGFIRDSLDQAAKDRADAEQKLAEYSAQITKGREEAAALVEQARRDAETVHGKIKKEAQAEAATMLERAKGEIDVARTTAVREIYEAGAQLATHAAAKILRRELDPAEHERLIAESIEELASQRN
ncbi:MAG: F0F1 ATP synthase subunit B [bacterium]|nr:F0F1 ATP synthase subunit B [bacterium]